MNSKSFFIAIVLCVGLQSNISFGSQQPQEKKTYWQMVKDWFANRATAVQIGALAGLAPVAVSERQEPQSSIPEEARKQRIEEIRKIEQKKRRESAKYKAARRESQQEIAKQLYDVD
jgi:hypothetical protein